MKLRLFCVIAALFAFAGAGYAADKKDDTSGTGPKKLTIPSVEMGGGSLGFSGTQPHDPNVPTFNDPNRQDRPVEPYIGLRFTKPLDGK